MSSVPDKPDRLRLTGSGQAIGLPRPSSSDVNQSRRGARVVLVGRTGLDDAARRARGAEVLRAATMLDGVAEAGIALSADSPTRCIVIVADDAIEQGEKLAGQHAMVDFVQAVKRVAPGTRVYRVGSIVDGACDGCVPARATSEVIEELMVGERGSASKPEPGPARRAEVEQREIEDLMAVMLDDVKPVAAATTSSVAAEATGIWTDETLVQMLGRGHSVWNEVERLLRARSGEPGLQLVPAIGGIKTTRHIEVVGAGRVLAQIECAAGVHASTLERVRGLSAWAGSWLALDEQMRALRDAAFKDQLTGAWNRRYFEKFLPAAIERARQAKRFVTILLFDIDDFKRWNDRYGHSAGDEVLRETVRMMESAVRPTDRVCRIGGDEFAVIFHEPEGPREVGSKHPEDVTGIAARFEALIRAKRFPMLGDGAPGRLGVSGGLATYPWDGRDMHELLRVADERAMGCKRHGKNAIVFGDAEGEPRA